MPGEPHDTVDRLRADIDSGRTGDKIPAPDPASAPLGTDEEAAGTPPTREAVASARRMETSGPSATPERRHGLGAAWVLVAAVVCIAVVVIVAASTQL